LKNCEKKIFIFIKMSSEKFNPSCPTFCYRTEYDNMAQKMWCPIAQQPIKDAQGQILGQDSNLLSVVTGGNMKRFNAEQNIVEGYQYGLEGRYRPVAQLNNDLQGPLCYGASSECHWSPHKPTKAPVTRPPVTRPPVTRPPVTRPPTTRRPMTASPTTRRPMTASPKVKETYCGCTSRQVMDAGVNMMASY
jgi:hypothetical protein